MANVLPATVSLDKTLTATFLKDDLTPQDDETYLSPHMMLGGATPLSYLNSSYRQYPVDRVFYNEEEYGVVYYNGEIVFCRTFELDFSDFVGRIVSIERTSSPYAGYSIGSCTKDDDFGYGDVIKLTLTANTLDYTDYFQGKYFFTGFSINDVAYGSLWTQFGCNTSYGENGLVISNLRVTKNLSFASTRSNLNASNYMIKAQRPQSSSSPASEGYFRLASKDTYNAIGNISPTARFTKVRYVVNIYNGSGGGGGGISTRGATRGPTTGGGGSNPPAIEDGYYIYTLNYSDKTVVPSTNNTWSYQTFTYDSFDSEYWGETYWVNGQHYPDDYASCAIYYGEAQLSISTTDISTYGVM